MKGGDWFHLQCAKINALGDKREFLCILCRYQACRSNRMLIDIDILRNLLKRHNRKTVKVPRDGNSVYTSLAVARGYEKCAHGYLRRTMAIWLDNLFRNPKYEGKWNRSKCPTEDECMNDPEKWMVHKVCLLHEKLIHEGREAEDIPLSRRLQYVKRKHDPAASPKEVQKYGDMLQLDLFCLMFKCCIWTLSPYSEDGMKVGYQWQCLNTYLPPNALAKLPKTRVELLQQDESSHYDCIMAVNEKVGLSDVYDTGIIAPLWK